eukprot:EG_transcript_3334
MDFQDKEDKEGVRWSWSLYPSSRIEGTRMVIPLGCLLTPLKQIQGMPVLTYEPVRCKTCQAILNPFCEVDYRSKLFGCPFCSTRNIFPQHYADISENNLPAELYSTYTTVEYKLGIGQASYANPNPIISRAPPPIFVYVVDVCLPTEKETEALKDALLMSLNLLPQNAQVAFITFGTTVQLHELGNSDFSKTWAFRGTKEVTPQQLVEFLSPTHEAPKPVGNNAQPTVPNLPDPRRFICTLSDVEFTLTSFVEELQPDPWPVPPNRRPFRATGAAISVAVALMETGYRGYGGRIMTFLAGPCTQGPGQTVSDDLSECIRLHNDLKADTAPFFQKSKKFFDALLPRCVANGHAVDVFVGSLDQVGVAEMKSLVQGTGGAILFADSFAAPQFKSSFQRFLQTGPDEHLCMAFNAAMEARTSMDWKIAGCIGPCVSRNKRSTSVGESEIGIGGTCQWGMSALDHRTTFAFYFDTVGSPAQQQQSTGRNNYRYLQVITRYQHPCGEYRLRVTTLPHRISETTNVAELAQAFDQEASAVLMARIAVFKADNEHLFDVLRWLDRHLIRLVAKFATFSNNDPSTLRLHPAFALFPQFCFHLRRSEFLQVFNSSPDETANFRIMLDRQTCSNCLIMIQPTLHCYSMKGPPSAVLLDSQSVQPDVILLLDSFFEVCIHHGETIAAWRNAKYQDQPEYAYFKLLLEAPKNDVTALLKERFPLPRITDCDQRGSQARILLNKINPSTTHNSAANQYGQQTGELMYTDDASLQTFMEHLKKLAVQS